MSITRRNFLRNSTAAGAVGVSVITPAIADADPYAKVERLAAELAVAMKAACPDIEFYDLDLEMGFFICSRGMKRGTRIGGGA